MVWIESHDTLAGHFKTSRLSAVLAISRAEAIGHLHMLWWWAVRYAPDGKLNRFQPREIADACDYKGDPEAFLDALVTAEFLDRKPLRIHDWGDYAGRLIARKEANRERMRAARAGGSPSIKSARASHMTNTSGKSVQLPDHTGPNKTIHTGPDQTRPDTDTAAVAASSRPPTPDEVAGVLAHYRDAINENAGPSGEREVRARLKERSLDELHMAIDKFARHSWWMEKHSHHSASWFFQSDDRVREFLDMPPDEGPSQNGTHILSHAEATSDPDRFKNDAYLQELKARQEAERSQQEATHAAHA
jgi:hypothetical protein